MACEVPCASYVALYVISMHIVNSNSRSSSSNHWKLNVSAGKVEQASVSDTNQDHQSSSGKNDSVNEGDKPVKQQMSHLQGFSVDSTDRANNEDRMMDILTNKVSAGGEWVVMSPDSEDKYLHVNKEHLLNQFQESQPRSGNSDCKGNSCIQNRSNTKSKTSVKKRQLTCGKKVNSTIYDHLRGVSERGSHSNIPEPDVAMVFKSNSHTSEVDMKELEEKLRQARINVEKTGDTQKEHTAQVYNLIGNFWRIKGNTHIAVECFRKALHLSPEEPDILLNLARVLYNLQYLDDAIFLARRSLHLQPSGENSWLQHFTLGEILKSYGHMQEAAAHFHQTLELNPSFAPAKSHLREIASGSSDSLGAGGQLSVTHFTLFIILFLVVGVLFGVVTSIETGFQESASMGSDGTGKFHPRHFNRAMAMRSIKLGINPRLCRLRRAANS